jgi:uncharacterized membrane protein YdjX (TVP38/TMEM64 family)
MKASRATMKTMSETLRRSWGWGWLRLLGVALVFVAVAILAHRHFEAAERWLTGLGDLAPLAFVAVYAGVVTVGFPVAVLGWLAGATFGFWTALVILTVAALLTATLIFYLARGLLAGQVRRVASARPRLARFLDLAGQDSLRLMVLLRLSFLHFALICYLAGASRVRFRPYLLATLCVLPSAATQAYVGHTARRLSEQASRGDPLGTWQIILAGSGILAAVLLIWLLGRLAQRALEDMPTGAVDAAKEN